jgi:cell division protein FtsL
MQVLQVIARFALNVHAWSVFMNRDPFPKTFGFARLLTALVVLTLLAAMSLIAVISSYFTRRSIQELSDRIVVQTLARVELRVDALLQQAITQNAQAQRLLARKQLVDDDFKLLGGYFSSSLEGLNDLTYLGLGRETNGDYLFAERLPDDTIRVREYLVDESRQRVIAIGAGSTPSGNCSKSRPGTATIRASVHFIRPP